MDRTVCLSDGGLFEVSVTTEHSMYQIINRLQTSLFERLALSELISGTLPDKMPIGDQAQA